MKSPRLQAAFALALFTAGGHAATVLFGSLETEHEQSCRALADSRVVVAAAIGTLGGDGPSFDRVRIGVASAVRDLALDAAPATDGLARLRPLAKRIDANARILVERQAVVVRAGAALRGVAAQGEPLLEAAENVMSQMLVDGESPAMVAAAGQLEMLSQRLARSADKVIGPRGVDPESVYLLGKDQNTASELLVGLLYGNPQLRLRPMRNPAAKAHLERAKVALESMRTGIQTLLANLPALVAARDSQAALLMDMDALGHGLALLCAGSDAAGGTPLRAPPAAER